MNKPTVALIVYEQMMPIHFAMAYSVFSMSDLNGKPLFDCKIVSDSDNLTNSLFHIHLDGGLEWLENADIVVMTGWHDTQVMPSEALFSITASVSTWCDSSGVMLWRLCVSVQWPT